MVSYILCSSVRCERERLTINLGEITTPDKMIELMVKDEDKRRYKDTNVMDILN